MSDAGRAGPARSSRLRVWMAGRQKMGWRRAFDVSSAVVLLIVAAPLLLLTALAVMLDSGRPILFRHRRLGKDGVSFNCWKFRTMAVGAQDWLERDPGLKRQYVDAGFRLPSAQDPRVTRIGRWLRRRHLDELPQLFNVLAGCMALVGPRPIVAEELVHYDGRSAELLSVRPGIVGAWTSLGRRRPDYPARARLELDYVRNRSAMTDLVILVRSVGVVLRGQEE